MAPLVLGFVQAAGMAFALRANNAFVNNDSLVYLLWPSS